MFELSPRQVHLDFHTSELIPDIGISFDPKEFAETIKEAAVSSMTLFARGHHGWVYYPSKKFPELIHPNLKNKTLLFDQIDALHNAGIRAPIYITVQWDYHQATTHPEWLVRGANGAHEGGSFTDPGFYQALCVNTEYTDFIEAQTREICEILREKKALDGVFFDIVGIRPCLCAKCRNDMAVRGIDMKDSISVRTFAVESLNKFKERMSAVVREYSDDCSIFYNAGHIGPCAKSSVDTFSHYELESLPSGGWGYLHFPATIRYARCLGIDCMGMTGKFHTSWGDFHSLKNLAALEFECFRMLSFGCACSIGDQLEPSGKINKATYNLIGSVYKRYAEYEQYGRQSTPLVEAAILTNESVIFEHNLSDEILGACQMLEELALQFDIIDADMDFAKYKLVIVPDKYVIDYALADKIDTYVKNGGKILAATDGIKGGENLYPKSFGVKYVKPLEKFPDFIIADGILSSGLEQDAEYAMYMRGAALESTGAKGIMNSKSPYFSREGTSFCSHSYTPADRKNENIYPSVFQNGNVITFSYPIFAQYRKNAPNWCKIITGNAIDALLTDKLIAKHNGPSTLCVSVLDQPDKRRVNLHLLSYIPVRKSATIDIVEDRTKITDITLALNLPYEIKSVSCAVSKKAATISGKEITVPEVDGYEIVVIEY